MKVRWERTTRVPRPPVWALILAGGWLLLVSLGVLLEQRGAATLETCLLHRLTGRPCPTCGSTRVVLGFVRGAWLEALGMNPLVAAGLVLGLVWLGLRLVTGRSLRWDLSTAERRLALALGLALLFANWAWVLRTQA